MLKQLVHKRTVGPEATEQSLERIDVALVHRSPQLVSIIILRRKGGRNQNTSHTINAANCDQFRAFMVM